jgi:hypothetical protein
MANVSMAWTFDFLRDALRFDRSLQSWHFVGYWLQSNTNAARSLTCKLIPERLAGRHPNRRLKHRVHAVLAHPANSRHIALQPFPIFDGFIRS